MKTTRKILCKCIHEFQDKQYGKQIRLCNLTTKSNSPTQDVIRCTVCGTLHQVNKE